MKRPNEHGFTMIELLIVLTIWSVLLLIVVRVPTKQIYVQQEKAFLNTFQMDVLYVQSISMGAGDKNIKIVFKDDRYEIVKGTNNSLIKKRSIPESFKMKFGTFHQVSFDQYGRIPKGGRFDIETPYTNYQVIFPLGKGRCYIIEV